MRKMRAAIRNVEKRNLAQRDSIRALEKQKESELRNAALGNRETRYQQMTTINLYLARRGARFIISMATSRIWRNM